MMVKAATPRKNWKADRYRSAFAQPVSSATGGVIAHSAPKKATAG